MSGSLRPRRARGGAFAPDRTDLDDVTPTAPSKPLGELMPKLDPAGTAASRSPSTPKGEISSAVGERARGAGGRPARAAAEAHPAVTRGVTKRPARIPADLYAASESLVKGAGKPSWGQLVYWACTTERDAVLERVLQQLAPADPLAPRGANRAGGVTTPIIPQFLGAEIEPVDEIQAAAQAQVDANGAPRPVKVTATAVVIAALRVAVERMSS
ncbi:hypothetical protein NYE39_17020 [Janibacter sp. FSL W8-0316]|uniref:hypothetical protein n=1 Tax=Janibacter sp. FSL W8-0316 TaxID=2975325 RepID=UPI0030FB794B